MKHPIAPLFGACALVLLSVFATLAAQTEAATKEDVLSLSNGQFYLHGKPFAEISFNKFDLVWELWAEALAGRELDDSNPMVALQDKALRELHELGFRTIRVFILPAVGREAFENPQQRALFYKALDKAFELCDRHQIQVYACLECAAFSEIGVKKKNPPPEAEHVRELVADPHSKSRQVLYAYLDAVIQRYKARKTVVMWDITNELTNLADITPGNHAVDGNRRPTLLEVARFYDDVCAYIKARDPQRLIGNGGSHLRESAWNLYTKRTWQKDTPGEHMEAYKLVYGQSAIDVADIHYYAYPEGGYIIKGDDGSPYPLNPAAFMKMGRELGKPLILGEFGALPNPRTKEARKDFFASYQEKEQAARWVRLAVDEVVAARVPLAYWWCYSSNRRQEEGHPERFDLSLERDPELLRIVADANRRLQATLGMPANAENKPPASRDDNGLLNNIDALKTARAQGAKPISVEELKAELPTLWDWQEQGKRPLNAEVVYCDTKNGVKVEGIYFNGYGNSKGQDRIFCYYARPEKNTGKIPAYIDITGGSEPNRSLWMAGVNKCAVLDIEWRGKNNRFRSKWVGGEFGSMMAVTALKENPAFRLVSGIRRAIDFLATQPEIDMERLGCGGGSMGGYYTLLTAGVDERIRFGMDELGAGFMPDTDSRIAQSEMDPERKKIWLAAFNPCTYAPRTKARIFSNFSANDYFFWLGDAVQNYRALPGEKRLCITPNFNHNDGAFGKTKNSGTAWLPYCMGLETEYLKITGVRNTGAAYTVATVKDANIREAALCWSPGGQVAWPSRYWVEEPAARVADGWRAEIPAQYAGLARIAFMSVRDARGRMVSSEPTFTPGSEPQSAPGPLWAQEQIWDVKSGAAAWRLIGPNVHVGSAEAVLALEGARGFAVGPHNNKAQTFSLVTNSLVLAAGHAKTHRGLKLEIYGKGQTGELKVTLVRNFGAVKTQREFTCMVKYTADMNTYELPWAHFKDACGKNDDIFPFESLRLDGKRPDGSPLSIPSITFL